MRKGRVEPEIRPFAIETAVQKGADPFVDVLAEARNLALRDAAHAHRPHQIVDFPRRGALDPGLLNDGNQRALGRLPRLQEAREVTAAPQLRNLQLERAEPGLQIPLTVAVAMRGALTAALVATGAHHSLHLELHQPLQHRFGELPQKVPAAALLQPLQQWHHLVGHRVHLRSVVERQQLNPTEEVR